MTPCPACSRAARCTTPGRPADRVRSAWGVLLSRQGCQGPRAAALSPAPPPALDSPMSAKSSRTHPGRSLPTAAHCTSPPRRPRAPRPSRRPRAFAWHSLRPNGLMPRRATQTRDILQLESHSGRATPPSCDKCSEERRAAAASECRCRARQVLASALAPRQRCRRLQLLFRIRRDRRDLRGHRAPPDPKRWLRHHPVPRRTAYLRSHCWRIALHGDVDVSARRLRNWHRMDSMSHPTGCYFA